MKKRKSKHAHPVDDKTNDGNDRFPNAAKTRRFSSIYHFLLRNMIRDLTMIILVGLLYWLIMKSSKSSSSSTTMLNLPSHHVIPSNQDPIIIVFPSTKMEERQEDGAQQSFYGWIPNFWRKIMFSFHLPNSESSNLRHRPTNPMALKVAPFHQYSDSHGSPTKELLRSTKITNPKKKTSNISIGDRIHTRLSNNSAISKSHDGDSHFEQYHHQWRRNHPHRMRVERLEPLDDPHPASSQKSNNSQNREDTSSDDDDDDDVSTEENHPKDGSEDSGSDPSLARKDTVSSDR